MSTVSHSPPLVSVIIPTYNRPQYLQAAIASVLNQTLSDLEVIVSDDGSLENPQAIVETFQDARIRFRRNATNLGVAWNVTHALHLAQGKYIASLNDDDQWSDTFLETLVTPLEHNPDLVLSFCDYFVMDAQGEIHDLWTHQQTQKEYRDRLTEGVYQPFWEVGLVDQAVFVSCAAVLRKTAIATDELPQAGVFWDYYLAYQACRTGQGAYYCPERLAYYRRHPASENMVSGSRNAQAKIRKGRAGIFCYRQFATDAPTASLRQHFQQEWAHASTTLAIGLMRDRQHAAARPYLLQAYRQSPGNLRTLIALMLSYFPQSLSSFISQLRNPGVFSKAR
jgi:glycosyltransferase involved in cell wall biosynthesis